MQGRIVDEQRRRAEARIDTWLWLTLRKNVNLSPENFDQESRREYLARLPYQIDDLIEFARSRRIIRIEELGWITDDRRQIDWLLTYVSEKSWVSLYPTPHNLTGKDLLLAKIDFYDVDLTFKFNAVEEMRRNWNEYLKKDSIFKWFEGEEEASRCAYAWEWLKKNKVGETYGQDAITTHKELLRFYDRIGAHEAQRKLDIAAIRKNWNQRQDRANQKDKKQYNFKLSHKALADLDKLATLHGVSRPQIIETLIKMEAAQGYHLHQKAKKTPFN